MNPITDYVKERSDHYKLNSDDELIKNWKRIKYCKKQRDPSFVQLHQRDGGISTEQLEKYCICYTIIKNELIERNIKYDYQVPSSYMW